MKGNFMNPKFLYNKEHCHWSGKEAYRMGNKYLAATYLTEN